MKLCAQCGKEFVPRHFNDKLCGPECKREWQLKMHREASARQRAKRVKVTPKSMEPRPCEICGEIYQPNTPNQRACSKVECRRGVGGALTVDSEVACVICGTKFLAKAGSYRKTCSNPACEFTLNSQTQKANREKERNGEKPPPPFGIPCPWKSGYMTACDMPPGVTSWSDPIMDPMSWGFPMRTFSVPNVAREVAA